VTLQMDDLCHYRTIKTLRRTLDSLPKTLDETYRRILDKISEYNLPLIQHILECICFSSRLLSVEELGHICRIGDQRKPPFDSEDALFHPEDVVDLCGGLLCLVVTDNWMAGWAYLVQSQGVKTVQLAHFSVKEYLLSSRAMFWRLDKEMAHLYVVKASIAYFLEFMASEDATALCTSESMHKFCRDHSLAVYCSNYTSEHLSELTPRDHPDLTESFRYLLDPTAQPTLRRKIGLSQWFFTRTTHKLPEPEPLEVSSLRIAVCIGLPMTCQWLLSINTLAQISSTMRACGIDSSFLNEAIMHHHGDVVKVLVAAGVDINQKWRFNPPALHTAAFDGSREMVEILINSGADINIEDNGITALDMAINRKHEAIVNILRDAGGRSTGNSQSRESMNVIRGFEELMKVWVERMQQSGNSQSPEAMNLFHMGLVKLLEEQIHQSENSQSPESTNFFFEELVKAFVGHI
jgi:ankyrin repeat domain-containing protein 50